MRTNRSIHRLAGVAAAAVTAAVFATGCGGSDSSHDGQSGNHASPTAGASHPAGHHNDADIAFVHGMIPHHQQAVEMAAMAAKKAGSAEVKALAAKIEQAQAPEIEQMTTWLTDWGVPAPSGSSGGHEMHGGMPGMMTDKDMKALMASSGAEFDQMFLEMMIRHHEGAVEMAKTEQQQGQNADAKALAKKIEADQLAEIKAMQTLLDK